MPRTQQSSESANAAATSTSSGGAAGPAASSSVTPQSPVSSGNYKFSSFQLTQKTLAHANPKVNLSPPQFYG